MGRKVKAAAKSVAAADVVNGIRMPEQVELWPVDRLVPYARNVLVHEADQVEEIIGSMRLFGRWTNPMLVDPDAPPEVDNIIAGHGRLLAAIRLQLPVVPVIPLPGLTLEEKRALRIADNKLGRNARWDDDNLAFEIRELRDAGYDTAGLGFAEDELARLLAEARKGLTDPEETPPPPDNPVTRAGDVWLLGPHRLICGDSREKATVAKLLGPVVPLLMVTDPPYGVDYDPEWREKAGVGSPNSVKAHGKVTNDHTASWADTWRLFPGSIAYIWHSGLHAAVVHADLASVGFELRAQIIWVKDRLRPSRGAYHWRHEPCFYMVKKGATGNWCGDRKQSTVWEIAHRKNDTGHSTQKPVEAMERPIHNHTTIGQPVYDPFNGSGTTIIACEQTGRVAYSVEIHPPYVDVSVLRWQAFTGQEARLEKGNATFAQVARKRGVELA